MNVCLFGAVAATNQCLFMFLRISFLVISIKSAAPSIPFCSEAVLHISGCTVAVHVHPQSWKEACRNGTKSIDSSGP